MADTIVADTIVADTSYDEDHQFDCEVHVAESGQKPCTLSFNKVEEFIRSVYFRKKGPCEDSDEDFKAIACSIQSSNSSTPVKLSLEQIPKLLACYNKRNCFLAFTIDSIIFNIAVCRIVAHNRWNVPSAFMETAERRYKYLDPIMLMFIDDDRFWDVASQRYDKIAKDDALNALFKEEFKKCMYPEEMLYNPRILSLLKVRPLDFIIYYEANAQEFARIIPGKSMYVPCKDVIPYDMDQATQRLTRLQTKEGVAELLRKYDLGEVFTDEISDAFIIAGGAVCDFIIDRVESDIDLFPCATSIEEAVRNTSMLVDKLEKHGSVLYYRISKFAATLHWKPHGTLNHRTIQIIKSLSNGASELLLKFDISASKAAIHSGIFTFAPEFSNAILERAIVLRPEDVSVAYFRRVNKYWNKGFRLVLEGMRPRPLEGVDVKLPYFSIRNRKCLVPSAIGLHGPSIYMEVNQETYGRIYLDMTKESFLRELGDDHVEGGVQENICYAWFLRSNKRIKKYIKAIKNHLIDATTAKLWECLDNRVSIPFTYHMLYGECFDEQLLSWGVDKEQEASLKKTYNRLFDINTILRDAANIPHVRQVSVHFNCHITEQHVPRIQLFSTEANATKRFLTTVLNCNQTKGIVDWFIFAEVSQL